MQITIGKLTVYIGSPWQFFVSRHAGEYTMIRIGFINIEWREWKMSEFVHEREFFPSKDGK